MKKITFLGAAVFLFIGHASFGQQKSDIIVKDIDVDLKAAPKYSLQGNAPPPVDADRKWLVVEAQLEGIPDWAEEVTVKFYVVANYGPNAKGIDIPADKYDVLTTTVTIVNMQGNKVSGKKNIVPVFMDSNTVKKYGLSGIHQFIPEVAVQVFYKGILQDTKWKKSEQQSGRFWEKKQPRQGILLNLMQSPWSPAFVEHYEQVKPSTGGPAF